jgi:hypothetical protein
MPDSNQRDDFDKLRNVGVPVFIDGTAYHVKEPKLTQTWKLIRMIVGLVTDLQDTSGKTLWEGIEGKDPTAFGMEIFRTITDDTQLRKFTDIIAEIVDGDKDTVAEAIYGKDIPPIIEAMVEVFDPSFFVASFNRVMSKLPIKRVDQLTQSDDFSEPTPSTN